jgi:SAM-dependent methyltransferase
MIGKCLQHFIATQQRWCRAFDRVLPASLRVEGGSHFRQTLVSAYVLPGMTVFDVGGGRHPFFSPEEKARLDLKVFAIDISEAELATAPRGAYDHTVCADICSYSGSGTADLAICQAVLEHVRDTNAAIRGLLSLLKPGGFALVWVPCRNALFARLNMLLPEHWKRRILFTIFPKTQQEHGFPAFYDRCTPRDFIHMARGNGVPAAKVQSYYMNSYFSFLLPMHMLWRIWQLIARCVVGHQACESISVALRKPLVVDDETTRFFDGSPASSPGQLRDQPL